MAFLIDAALDAALAELGDGGALHITSQEVTAHADVATYTLGNKASPTIGSPQDRAGGGREAVIAAFSDGSVTATGTATHWCLVDTVNSRVLAANTLTASQAVTSGNTFQLAAIAVSIADAVSA